MTVEERMERMRPWLGLLLLSVAVSPFALGQPKSKAAAKAPAKQVPTKAIPLKQGQSKAAQIKPLPGRQVAARPLPAKQVAGKQLQGKAAPAKQSVVRGKQQYAATRRAAPPRYYAPVAPSADRYRDIQAALSSRGYFNGPVDGVWGTSSTEALKRFQHDQNLAEEGKIDSLSLIALGLGPKRAATAAPPTSTIP
jgi:Putative peptidoglycan binding domain